MFLKKYNKVSKVVNATKSLNDKQFNSLSVFLEKTTHLLRIASEGNISLTKGLGVHITNIAINQYSIVKYI